MPSILDRLLGRKPAEPKKEEPQKVSEEAARLRREQLAKEKADMEAARKRAEEEQKKRLEEVAQKAKTAVGTVAEVITDAVTGQRTYVVKSGDSLSKIAKAIYGDGKRWPEIYEANKALIGDNPNLIHPGQTLKIP